MPVRRRFNAAAGCGLLLWAVAAVYGAWASHEWVSSSDWPHPTLEVLLQWQPELPWEPLGLLICRLFTMPMGSLLLRAGAFFIALAGAMRLAAILPSAFQCGAKPGAAVPKPSRVV